MGQFFEFAFNHPLLMSALLAIVIMLVMNEFKQKLLGFKEVKPNEAVQLINREDAVVLDVRDDKEFSEGHIINAINIPLGLLDGRIAELDDYRQKPVVVCCKSGRRAAKAGSLLQRQGFSSIYKLNGGMMAWISAELPVNTQ